MDITAIIRTGFSISNPVQISSCRNIIYYKIGEPFHRILKKVIESGTKYVLFVDETIGCSDRKVWLLHQLLESNSEIFGITMNSKGLGTVYGISASSNHHSRLSWSVFQIATLPSWFALLQVSLCKEVKTQTPEYFLLSQSHNQKVISTFFPEIDFDQVKWAGDIISSAATDLGSDYEFFRKKNPDIKIPLQFRVTIPGENKIPNSLNVSTTDPVFSIICPSIRPDFLREAVTSVINQTYQNWELWVGIDGPKEIQRKKIEIILKDFHQDPRIRIRYFEHMGTGPLRRLLSEYSRGHYITGLDDDDRLPPNALERFAQAVKDNPGVPILRGGIRLFGLMDLYLSPKKRYRIDGISNDLFEVNQPYVIRKDILETLGGLEWDPDMKNAGEDSDLLLKADREGLAVHLIDEPLYERRLSTFNQTLDCTADECRSHIHNLYKKHNPDGWILSEVHLSGAGTMINMVTTHRHPEKMENIVCSTQFMNFQQVGSPENIVIDLEITSLCTANCTFCPHPQSVRNSKFISAENVNRIASFFKGKSYRPTIVLCGIGEPTLHAQLEEIISILARANMNVCMTTNGWNLTVPLVDKLVNRGLSELNVSLNAATKCTHEKLTGLKNFDEIVAVCKEITLIRTQKWPSLKFHLSFVLNKQNENEIKSFVDQWKDLNVDEIWLHPLTNRAGLIQPDYPAENLIDISDKFSDEKKVKVDLFSRSEGPCNMCHIAGEIDFISVDGEMLLCAQDYKARYQFGNVATNGLEGLRSNKVIRHLRGETAGLCSKCTFSPPSFRMGQDISYTIVQSGAI